MKFFGLFLVVAALGIGGYLLSQTLPRYSTASERLADAKASANAAGSPVEPGITSEVMRERTAALEEAMLEAQFAERSMATARSESLVFGGGALGVIAIGTVLFLVGRRRNASAQMQPQPA
jgi:hypothetical protein